MLWTRQMRVGNPLGFQACPAAYRKSLRNTPGVGRTAPSKGRKPLAHGPHCSKGVIERAGGGSMPTTCCHVELLLASGTVNLSLLRPAVFKRLGRGRYERKRVDRQAGRLKFLVTDQEGTLISARKSRMCKGCWQQLHVPIPLRGIAALSLSSLWHCPMSRYHDPAGFWRGQPHDTP